ncbi:MAG TPA: potassium-transporting ATPase subunit KdpC [Casimicrobiaceae bacterium]|nr:potassium-transporting ATPase subunit KdpC [Casimicrobiaceae bacterium]
MWSSLVPAVRMLVVLSLLTGVVYPVLTWGIAQVAFRDAANGSLITSNGKAVGSALIGQPFGDPKHFWSRPSATSPQPYNGGSSSGSNLGPRNPALADAVADRIKALREADPGNSAPVPADLVTTSGSGLDPHISLAAAEFQVARVAKARGMSPEAVRALVAQNTEGRTFGVLGESRVNVLKLNLALDQPAK